MIDKKLNNSSNNQLLKDLAFITLIAILFFLIIGKFGGYISDYFTKKGCNSANSKYISSEKPGSGTCIKK